ncbi:hypothetical protein B566_EDAN004202 [Ephemera danica]|nr:hypothetical protein B566_EDAN004202 [Ephemera danica]
MLRAMEDADVGGDREDVRSTTPGRQQTWSDLYSEVCELRRQLSSLASMLPSSLAFRSVPGTGRTRIYFLGAPPSTAWESTLLAADVPAPGDADANRSGGRLSREEQLLWERKRLATWGLTSFELHAESGRLVFPVASRLYQCVDLANTAGALCPTELQPSMGYAKLNPQICPHNPDLVAFVCLNDIWVTHTFTGSTVRLTHYHKGPPSSLSEDPLSAGIPSYVMQEEFSRYAGCWWQPVASTPGVYRIAFELVDESAVDICCFPSAGSAEEFRFPRAGTPNAKSELKVAQFRLSSSLQITDVRVLGLVESLRSNFPFLEYLVRVGWTPEGSHVWCQLLDRRQQRLDLALIPIESFSVDEEHSLSEPSSPPHLSSPVSPPNSSPAHTICTLYSETSDVWVNVHDVLYFFPVESSNCQRTFLWASEESGFRHLYLLTVALGPGAATNCVDELPGTQGGVFSFTSIVLC